MAEWNPRDRLAIRTHIRAQMRARNLLQFCDDDPEAVMQAANHPLLSASHLWAQESANSPALIEEGVSATTTDHWRQSIGELDERPCFRINFVVLRMMFPSFVAQTLPGTSLNLLCFCFPLSVSTVSISLARFVTVSFCMCRLHARCRR